GDGNTSVDSYYGSGVYLNGTLLTDPVLGNPLTGKAINKIIVDPANSSQIWVAASDLAHDATAGNAGIWRYDGTNWVNLVATANVSGGTATNYGVLPTANIAYSDIAYDGTKLYAAIAGKDVIV